jgi:hypothetical protein
MKNEDKDNTEVYCALISLIFYAIERLVIFFSLSSKADSGNITSLEALRLLFGNPPYEITRVVVGFTTFNIIQLLFQALLFFLNFGLIYLLFKIFSKGRKTKGTMEAS